jgi:hypothetical protein
MRNNKCCAMNRRALDNRCCGRTKCMPSDWCCGMCGIQTCANKEDGSCVVVFVAQPLAKFMAQEPGAQENCDIDPIFPFACPKSLSHTNSCASNWDSWTLAQGHHIPIHSVGHSTSGLGSPAPHLELPNVPKPDPKGQGMTPSTSCS